MPLNPTPPHTKQITTTTTSPSTTPSLLRRLTAHPLPTAVGRLTLPLYFLHQILSDFYLCLAVEGRNRDWGWEWGVREGEWWNPVAWVAALVPVPRLDVGGREDPVGVLSCLVLGFVWCDVCM